jgi:hypothetical protein
MSTTTGSLSGVGLARESFGIMRRAGAVLAGLVAIVILSTAMDGVLHAIGVYPPPRQPMSDGLYLLATAYRIVYGVAGGYITARLAPDRPTEHALALGWVGVVISVAGAAAMWAYGPAWYSLLVITIALPSALAGGHLHQVRSTPPARSDA